MQNPDDNHTQSMIRWIIPALLAAVLISACSKPVPPQLEQATLLPSGKPVTDFQLTDHNGQSFTLENLRDKWTFAFFGYTHCPDVCPTSLAMLGQVQRKFEKQPALDALPQMVFFSVDPERDTPELLSNFVPYFHPDFVGATGDPKEILALTRQLGILYAKAEGSGADDYLVDHSAAIILFDPEGRFHALFGVPHDPDLIASDFLLIKDYYEALQ
jgi:protein SCO1/2